MSICSSDLFDKFARISDAHCVPTESTEPDDPKVVVTQHDRVRRAPFHVSELFRINEIDLGFDRRVKTVFPGSEFRQDRGIAPFDSVTPRREDVSHLTFKHKDRRLRFAYDQSRPVLDLLLV